MKIKHLLFTLILFLFVSSCNTKVEKHNIQGEVINVSLENENFKETSKYIKKTKFIKLEDYVTESIFGVITKITVKNNFIYIMDENYKKLLVFDMEGKFVRKIGKFGNGPGEYATINDFHVNDTGNIIILDGNREKLYWYDSLGNFVEDKKIPFETDIFTLLDNEQYLFGLSAYNHSQFEGDQLITTSKSFEKTSSLLEYTKYVDENYVFNYHLIENEKGFVYNRIIDNNVHQLSKTGEIERSYIFDFGKLNFPETDKKNMSRSIEKDYCYLLSVPIISNGLILGNIKSSKAFHSFVYNINSKNIYINNYKNYSIKDINFPLGITEDSKIITYINSDILTVIGGETNDVPEDFNEHIDKGGHIVCITELINSK
ncbi:6-bladed beta-propeller [Flavivirga jejuensis]|uniref:6-bladed beta-propeller n=1 Tax=Flavivirga jejuensis TaxID=870487 RepID=A0ABT8WRZ0_9FLAO|nr:6-bladed beta-propeller [Flavivirga jejuensis]MDO5975933.1 6-bladed beta-propeller [Flavivirga jejuensis]